MLFKSYPSKYLLRDRNEIRTGPFGFSIMTTCLAIIVTVTILYAGIWQVESEVLMYLFGFKLPLAFKFTSVGSTAFLYLVFSNSVGMMYMLIISCMNYFIIHTILFGFLMQIYFSNEELLKGLFSLIYHEQDYTMFYLFMSLSLLRILLCFPLIYYILVLSLMCINGGRGWDKKAAHELEQEHIGEQVKTLHERLAFLEKKYDHVL